eukprot:TRINITY_DN1927_c0_g1_i5.p1 TRINITY_DN1927_c0_g1~~TRINITY_DN1927_c0_g1_i5.p1  ORF type:complete len:799 (+),score=229.79 TRINITY_DN1927_c0_g1_i5:87-2483(+)
MHSDTFVIFALLVILGFLLLPPIVTRPPLSESSFVTHQPGEEEVENDSSASPFASFSNDTELVQFISPFLDETSKPSSERVVEYDEFERTIRCQRENESSFERRLIRMEGEYIYVGCPVQHKLSISRLRDYNDSSLEGTVVHRRSFQGGVPIALFLYDGILVVFLRDERIAKTVNLHTFHRTHTTTIITRVVFMDVRDPAHPRDLKSFSVNGEYVEARLVDSYMYFVVAHRNCVHRVFDSPYGVDVDFPEIVEERRTWRPRMFHFRQPSHMFEFHSIVSVDLNENGNNGGGFDGGESHVNDRSEVDEKINKRDEQKGSDSKSKESSSGATSMGKKLSISSSSIHAQSFLLGYGSELYMSRNNLFISHPIHRSYGQEKEESERVFVSAVLPLLPADIRSSLWESRSGDRHQFDWMKVRAIMRDMYNDMDDEEARSLESKIAHHVEEFYRKLRLQNDRTWIHKFSCNRGIVRYSCGTTVPGHIRNSFSMDEYDGYLRVATTSNEMLDEDSHEAQDDGKGNDQPDDQPDDDSDATKHLDSSSDENPRPSPTKKMADRASKARSWMNRFGNANHVFVFDSSMTMIGKLINLGFTEHIRSTRFSGDRLYMVTFRQIDPLFVIDLSIPTKPTVLGELKIPGYSDYLHPYDETHVIGVGRNSEEQNGGTRVFGVKISLFDVSDVENPVEMSNVVVGDSRTTSEVFTDHKAFLFSKSRNLVVLPTSSWGSVNEDGKENVVVARISPEHGVDLIATLTNCDGRSMGYGACKIFRSLFVKNVLYTISQQNVVAFNVDGFHKKKTIPLF